MIANVQLIHNNLSVMITNVLINSQQFVCHVHNNLSVMITNVLINSQFVTCVMIANVLINSV